MSASKPVIMKSLAANRLSDGVTVWAINRGGVIGWSEQWSQVVPVQAEDDIAALTEFAEQQVASDIVVSERLIDVLDDISGGYIPQRMRERICTSGPTIRQDLGKQADFAARPAAA